MGTELNYSNGNLSSLGPQNKEPVPAFAQLPLQVEVYLEKGSTSNSGTAFPWNPFRKKMDSSLRDMVDHSSLR